MKTEHKADELSQRVRQGPEDATPMWIHSSAHLQCQHSHEEVGETLEDCVRYSEEQETLSQTSQMARTDTWGCPDFHIHTVTCTNTYTHVLMHTNMHRCIHMHSHTQKLNKSTAFETKTASPNSCFLFPFLCLTSKPLVQHLHPLISLASDSSCIGPLSQCATAVHLPHPSTPISVLARRASAKWVSSVKSGDFLHEQLQLPRCPGTYLSGISLHRYFLNLLSDLSLTLNRAFHTQQQSAWRRGLCYAVTVWSS